MTTISTDLSAKNKIGSVTINDYRIIPVVFIPGVMGSNLKDGDDNVIWRYDDDLSLIGWSLPGSGPEERKKLLHPDRVQVDNRGVIISSQQQEQQSQIMLDNPVNKYDSESIDRLGAALKKAQENDPETKLFGTRAARGWGEVAAASYGSFLDLLQLALFRDKPCKDSPLNAIYKKLITEALGVEFCSSGNRDSLDEQALEVMKQYQFPVHAMGYNWLGSNMKSADHLKSRINKIVQGYKNRGMKCHKVILVTHSMGGLVARYYSECLDLDGGTGNQNIYGIVHGVMPSTGAAPAYTRMKRGTENPESSAKGYITSQILGRNAAEMTAICSQSAGPLELLPSVDYGTDWLKITDRHGVTTSLPGNNPYANLYLKRDVWWKLIDENLLNPYNVLLDKIQIEADWEIYSGIMAKVKEFHDKITGKYHPNTYSFYGKVDGVVIPPAYLTQEIARWKGSIAIGDAAVLKKKYILNDGRLDYREIKEKRTVADTLSEKEQSWKVSSHGSGYMKSYNSEYVYIGQCFTLQDSSENGDGTVPLRAGKIPDRFVKERLSVNVSHEAAYRNETSLAFTLRSIIKIAQQVNDDEEMAYTE
ncbi:TPA: lipase family alpha/beta hydrolase [Klebsiella quasipneumoniae]